MPFFGKDPKTVDLRATERMVEGVIRELSLDPSENRLHTDEGNPAWGLMKGSAQVFIFINAGNPDEPNNFLQVVSPLMKVPPTKDQQLRLFSRLLTANARELTGVGFGLKGDTVVLTTDRSTADLDPSEVKEMILRVGYYADAYDDALVSEYGGTRHSDLD